MGFSCLSCKGKVDPNVEASVRFVRGIMLCNGCADNAAEWLRLTTGDLKNVERFMEEAFKKGILGGDFEDSWGSSTPRTRLHLLVHLVTEVTKPCHSPQIPISSPPQISSTTTLPPNVATLVTLGRKGSPS